MTDDTDDMQGFIGRESELQRLESIRKSGYRTCAILGRRRIGKTALIDRFCEDKQVLKIPFIVGSEEQNVERMCLCISEHTGSQFRTDSLEETFQRIEQICKEDIILVFDEYPYMAATSKRFPSMLQHLVDSVTSSTESMVIICGSSLSVMKDTIEDYQSPLYGRFMSRIELDGLPFDECRLFHPGMKDVDLLKLYLTVGGVPIYHRMLSKDIYWANIVDHFIGPDADMANEGESIVSRESRASLKHVAVTRAVASGSTSLKRIAESTGLDDSLCRTYLNDLISIGVVGTDHPMVGAGKRIRYRIDDPMVDFFFSVTEPTAVLATSGTESNPIIDSMVSTFLGKRFESFCAEFMMRNYRCAEVGKWWGPVFVDGEREDTDIDLVATVYDGVHKVDVLGECKFKNRLTGFTVLNTLKTRAEATHSQFGKRLALFSVSGFEDDLIDYAEANGIMLFDLDVLTGAKRVPELD